MLLEQFTQSVIILFNTSKNVLQKTKKNCNEQKLVFKSVSYEGRNIFNRPGVAGAVLQKPLSLIN